MTSAAVIHADATTQSAVVGQLRYQQQLDLRGRVRGERFVVGGQTWAMAIQSWSNLWYQIDGGYVYSAYVWVPKAGQVLPSSLPAGERWVNVNLATQTAQALVGDRVVYTADVTSGKDGYETPTGHWRVNYQVLNETMTSSQAGINDPTEHYDVKNVLFTQYFDGLGDALHLNYWQPESVFGNARSSHGCVGVFLQDAQWLWMFGQAGMRVEINSNGRLLPPPQPPPTNAPAPRSPLPLPVTAAPPPAPVVSATRPVAPRTATPTATAITLHGTPTAILETASAPTPGVGGGSTGTPARSVAATPPGTVLATPRLSPTSPPGAPAQRTGTPAQPSNGSPTPTATSAVR